MTGENIFSNNIIADKRRDVDKPLSFDIIDCHLGRLLLAATDKGIAAVYLGDNDEQLQHQLRHEFGAIKRLKLTDKALIWQQNLLAYLNGKHPWPTLPFDITASPFKLEVWQQLRLIPSGEVRYYSNIAAAIGRPRAIRAVARACATNPAALIIPCHRVIAKNTNGGGYRWGMNRKQAILDLEQKLSN